MRFGDKLQMRLQDAVSLAKRLGTNAKLRFVDVVSTQPFFTPPNADARKLLELYNKNPWVRTIVAKIAGAVAKQPWYLEGPGGKRIDEHEALEFIRRGSSMMGGRQALKLTQIYIETAGEAFWALGRTGVKGGRLTEYAPIPPHWVVDIPHDGQEHFVVSPRSGERFDIPANQLLWFRDVDPADPYGRGRSRVGSALTEIQTDEAASEFLYAHFKNHCRPSLIISGSADKPIDDQTRRRGEAAWAEKFRGVEKAGRAFWSSGPLTVNELGHGLRDNAIPQMRELGAKALAEIWNMPPELLGRLESSNRATIESADYLFALHLTEPRLAALLDVLEPFIAAEFNLGAAKLRYETPVQDDWNRRLAFMSAFRAKFTGNEARIAAGMPRSDEPGMDDLMDEPALLTAFGKTGGDDPEADPPKPGKPKPKADDDEDKAAPDVRPALVDARTKAFLSVEDIVRVSKAHEDPEVRAQAVLIMDRVMNSALVRYGAELLEQLEAGFNFVVNTRVAQWLTGKGETFMSGIDETTRKTLQSALLQGVADGANAQALSDAIDDVFRQAADMRSEQIGITEATELTGFGTHAAAEQAGFQEKMWLTSQDQVVRDTHNALDGQVKLMSEKFVSPSGAQADYPGGFGVASEDINCRCAIRPVVPGEKAHKMTTPQYRTWHAYAHAHVAGEVQRSIRNIFEAQADVTKAQLRRVLEANGAG